MGTVTINPIPNTYVIPTGTINITSNGATSVSGYASANVNVQPSLQDKTVSPTESQQIISADNGYDGLDEVTINAIETEAQTITTNGTYIPSTGKFFSNIIVGVPTLYEALLKNKNYPRCRWIS